MPSGQPGRETHTHMAKEGIVKVRKEGHYCGVSAFFGSGVAGCALRVSEVVLEGPLKAFRRSREDTVNLRRRRCCQTLAAIAGLTGWLSPSRVPGCLSGDLSGPALCCDWAKWSLSRP